MSFWPQPGLPSHTPSWCALFGFLVPFGVDLDRLGLVFTLTSFVLLAAIVLYTCQRKLKSSPDAPEKFPGELGMLRSVIASLPDLIYVKDTQSRFLLANQGTAEVMGAKSGDELVGKTDFDYYPRELADGFYRDEQKIIETGQPLVSQDEHVREADGRTRFILTTKVPLRNDIGTVVGIVGIGRNVTSLKETEAELKRARENLHFKATHDSLTSLLNREAILDMLEREVARNEREQRSGAVLLADLDHFKEVNDRHGHLIGDHVLRETARRLLRAVRTYDLVGRYGGEEFVLILGGCGGPEALSRADQLRCAVAATPIPTPCGPVDMTISIGVLSVEEWGRLRAPDLLREVDVALYAAKAAGRNCCRMATRH